ncbi:MAG: glycine cleavage system transcriptional repressor [Frankiales bacterium]|jgi:glycine cleavage system transcriptional repressor|nr:glycine cleavage system transcriptional repressor [Frankiales bacterium]
MSLLAVTVIGVDRPGIIAAVTGALAQVGGNLEDSSMTILGGHFAMSLIVSVDAGEDAVRRALEPATGALGLAAFVGEVTVAPGHTVTGAPYVVSVHGADRPGIVSRVMGVIASYGGNVTDLTTRLSGDLYVVVADVDVPLQVDLEALRASLDAAAEELGVDVTVRAADPDLL